MQLEPALHIQRRGGLTAVTAIQSQGGDEMIDISIQETWFWAYVLNSYAVNIEGTVIKKK